MANVSIQADHSTMELMKAHYKDYIAARTPKNARFLVLGETCIITAYESGKVTFLGKGATEESAQWSPDNVMTLSTTKSAPPTQQKEKTPTSDVSIEPKKEEPKVDTPVTLEKEPVTEAPLPIEEQVEEPKSSETIINEETSTQPSKTEDKIIEAQAPSSLHSKIEQETTHQPPAALANLSLIGSFEIGSGDYFGPLTVVAAYVPPEKVASLRKLGVLEVKGMKDKDILEIAKKVISACEYAAVNVSNEKYNEYIQNGTTVGELKARLHNQAIRKVLEKISPVKPDGVLIDQFVEADTYFQYLEKEKEVIREHVYFKQKAENAHISTAAASIIAKYSYLRSLEKLTEIAGFKLPRGVNLPVDKAASRLLKSYGLDALGTFVKLHFPNTQKARTIARR